MAILAYFMGTEVIVADHGNWYAAVSSKDPSFNGSRVICTESGVVERTKDGSTASKGHNFHEEPLLRGVYNTAKVFFREATSKDPFAS